MRTAIYARYSSHLQNSRSIEDQIAVCRQRAEREGWQVVEVYTDYAISGAAGIEQVQRPGLNALLDAVEAGKLDQVLAESTDRIARHQGDSFAIRERLEYAGVRLFTLSDGHVDDITGTIKGLFDARFRRELAAKIKRGQQGSIRQGRSPAGLAYGYRKANRLDAAGNLVRGLREIDDEQAAVVLRIFTEYAAGQSPRAIAQRLNEENIPGPTGGTWRTSTIAGDRKRQNGILQNRLYAGVLIIDRTSKVIDPRTRTVRIRPNAEADWKSEPVEHLRIIDEATWETVSARRKSHEGMAPEKCRRPKHLLSGIAVCGVCGGGWSVIGRGRWGCSKHRDGRGCSNNRTITTELMDRRVMAGLQKQMLDPEAVRIYVAEYHRDYARRSATLASEGAKLRKRHADAAAKVERLFEAFANGGEDFVEMKPMLAKARADRDGFAAELERLEAIPVVALHPKVAGDYRDQVEKLTTALAANPDTRLEVHPIIRALIDRVSILPNLAKQKGIKIEVTGRLAAIIALATGEPVAAPMYANGGAGSGNRTRV